MKVYTLYPNGNKRKIKKPNRIMRVFCDALSVESIIWTVQTCVRFSCCTYFIFVGKNGIFIYLYIYTHTYISIYRYVTITFQNAAKTQVVFPNKQSIYWIKPRQCCVVKCLVLLRIAVLLGCPLDGRTSGGTGEILPFCCKDVKMQEDVRHGGGSRGCICDSVEVCGTV